MGGPEHHVPLRDRLVKSTVKSYNKPPRPGEVYIENGQPLGVVMSVELLLNSKPISVIYQEHDFI